MNAAALRQAVRPTAAALPWSTVVPVGLVLVGAAAAAQVLTDRPTSLGTLAGAALASGAVAALHDPADRLLAPVPTSRLLRRLLRVGLVGLVVVPLLAVVDRLAAGSPDVWATSLALLLVGLALATWLPEGRGVLVAAAVPVTWVAVTQQLGDSAGALDVWASDPWVIASAAFLAILAGRGR